MDQVPLVGEGGTLVMEQTVNQGPVMVITGVKAEHVERLRSIKGGAA